MIADFHFLRPWWLLAIFILMGLIVLLGQQNPRLTAWEEVCDPHLLKHLLKKKGKVKSFAPWSCLLLSALFMIFSIAGPAWYQLPVSTYKPIQPRVLVLDMSRNMMVNDLTPNRLSRAKFKLRDLLTRKDVGQFGLVVFTGEPFVVSPLTDDGQTIASLLSTLTPDIMPVTGQKLDTALSEASRLIQQAGYKQGQILVLTADTPTDEARNVAKKLAQSGVLTSIMPIKADKNLNPLYQRFAEAGRGQVLMYSPNSTDLDSWIEASTQNKTFIMSAEDSIPLWRDEGRWFLIIALLFLIPVFQRGWLQKVTI